MLNIIFFRLAYGILITNAYKHFILTTELAKHWTYGQLHAHGFQRKHSLVSPRKNGLWVSAGLGHLEVSYLTNYLQYLSQIIRNLKHTQNIIILVIVPTSYAFYLRCSTLA